MALMKRATKESHRMGCHEEMTHSLVAGQSRKKEKEANKYIESSQKE